MDAVPRSLRWRRSSFSSNGTDCVELAHDLAAVRDSKSPQGQTLRVDARRLVAAIRLGQVN